MRRHGRPVDQDFQHGEKLFRRYAADHLIDGKFSPLGLPFDTPPSVNREKFSESQDVLFSETNEFANWGVWSIKVGDLPAAFHGRLSPAEGQKEERGDRGALNLEMGL